ncbi:hypothetical protein P154DRAFT_585815 [Amniculicola lignicola CBS 123094]|uniref:ATPase AAA-type core domain-containing protein n=1 Tax=Amniculicola lignicola CBS 123094 TaxID=1392246 RepID=A0A6A5VXT1_9PLEO|nr:hypothetical protein P154DRAFT_585815 [Amniculicola lignicola CBS 123094]
MNKGQGLAGLSGAPGVSKALTAEAVAEVIQRPLYMVSAGELGIEPVVVHKRLGMILEVTGRWGCVLLIDEADVFLAARQGHPAECTYQCFLLTPGVIWGCLHSHDEQQI